MPSETLVEVKKLVKTFGPLRAVDGLSFQVRRGEIVGLLGVNGAGKSTLMKVLTCYLAADEGTAAVAGVSIDEDPLEVRRHIGYLPENAPLYTEMRVKDFLDFAARMRGMAAPKRKERVAWAVAACGLQPKYLAPIGTLSHGYRQRVGIAQAILHDPDLLILDEPTSGLDPVQIIEIRRLIMEIGKTKTVFFSTHIMQEVEAVCGRALIINKGKLVADGSPAELKRRPGVPSDRGTPGSIVARLRGASSAEVERALSETPGLRRLALSTLPDLGLLECTLQCAGDGQADAPGDANAASERFFGLAKAKGWTVLELRREGVNLEDAFLALTGHARREEKQAAPEPLESGEAASEKSQA